MAVAISSPMIAWRLAEFCTLRSRNFQPQRRGNFIAFRRRMAWQARSTTTPANVASRDRGQGACQAVDPAIQLQHRNSCPRGYCGMSRVVASMTAERSRERGSRITASRSHSMWHFGAHASYTSGALFADVLLRFSRIRERPIRVLVTRTLGLNALGNNGFSAHLRAKVWSSDSGRT